MTHAELLGGTPFLGFIAAVAFKGQNVAFMVSLTFRDRRQRRPGVVSNDFMSTLPLLTHTLDASVQLSSVPPASSTTSTRECGAAAHDAMPTIWREGPYRFFFYASDRPEPMHVHVEVGGRTAKFWLRPVRLQTSRGLARHELSRLEGIVVARHEHFVRAWNEYFEG